VQRLHCEPAPPSLFLGSPQVHLVDCLVAVMEHAARCSFVLPAPAAGAPQSAGVGHGAAAARPSSTQVSTARREAGR
jgi:hypothetical protein